MVLVWHHQPNGRSAVAEIISFPPGKDTAFVRIGAHGGSMHFVCADTPGDYVRDQDDQHEENSGVCRVSIVNDSHDSSPIRPVLPITASRESATWTVSKEGAVSASIKYTVGPGSGSKKYGTALVVEYKDGTVYRQYATATIGRDLFSTKRGTKRIDKPSIPLEKLDEVRHAYVTYSVDKGASTLNEWADKIVDAIKKADEKYRQIKDTELVQDAVTLTLAATGQ